MIGLRLRQLRQEYKISCKQFGKDIELSASALSDYETGISVPSIRITLRIAEYFHVSIDYLLGRSEFRNQEEVGERVKKKVEKQYINTLIDRDMMAKMKKNKIAGGIAEMQSAETVSNIGCCQGTIYADMRDNRKRLAAMLSNTEDREFCPILVFL